MLQLSSYLQNHSSRWHILINMDSRRCVIKEVNLSCPLLQMMLGLQWAAHMTTPMAPCPITHTMVMAWDPCLTMAHMDLTDTAMEWDPCPTTALMMVQWDPCQTMALMTALWDPCQIKAHMVDQMEGHMEVQMEVQTEAHMGVQMEAQMEAHMGAHMEALVEVSYCHKVLHVIDCFLTVQDW